MTDLPPSHESEPNQSAPGPLEEDMPILELVNDVFEPDTPEEVSPTIPRTSVGGSPPFGSRNPRLGHPRSLPTRQLGQKPQQHSTNESTSYFWLFGFLLAGGAILAVGLGVGVWLLKSSENNSASTPPPATSFPSPPIPGTPRHSDQEEMLRQEIVKLRGELASMQRQVEFDKVNRPALPSTLDMDKERQDFIRNRESADKQIQELRTKLNVEESRLVRSSQELNQALARVAEAERTRDAVIAEHAVVKANILSQEIDEPLGPTRPDSHRVPLLDGLGAPINPNRPGNGALSPEKLRELATGSVVKETLVERKNPEGIAPLHRETLLKEIDQALALLAADKIEEFVEDYYPIDLVRELRNQAAISQFVTAIRENEEALKDIRNRLEACRKATIEGDNDIVQFISKANDLETGRPIDVTGYGDDLPKVLERAITDLKAGNFETFLEKMLPVPEVIRLRDEELLTLTAALFQDNPAMVSAMLADLEAISALDLPPTGEFVRLSLSGRNKDEKAREIRFQKVGAAWRFFDQTTPMEVRRKEVDPSHAVRVKALLQFERNRDHWRLTQSP